MWKRCVQRPENIMRYVSPRTQHADVPTPPLTTHHSLLTAQKPVLMFICLISKEICGHLSHLRNLCAIVKRRTLNECRNVACSVRGFYSRKSRESRQRLRAIFRESVRL